MTPTSETALEIGCDCTTTLMAQSTAITAKTRKRMTSMSGKPGNQKAGHQQIQDRHREEKLPGEAHELVVAEAWQRAANPHEGEKDEAGLGAKPEQRQEPALDHGQQKYGRDDEEDHAESRQRQPIAAARRV